MPTCKNCGTKIKLLSYLLVRGDGLCDECGARYEAERKDPTAAERHMHELLDKLAPQTEWLLCGLGLWTTTGHRASQTASLWAGRALFGVAGDMVHSESRLLGIFGLSANGVLHRLRIGECSNITPEIVYDSEVIPHDSVSSPKSELSIATERPGVLNLETTNTRSQIVVEFPKCFLSQNEEFPTKLQDEWRK